MPDKVVTTESPQEDSTDKPENTTDIGEMPVNMTDGEEPVEMTTLGQEPVSISGGEQPVLISGGEVPVPISGGEQPVPISTMSVGMGVMTTNSVAKRNRMYVQHLYRKRFV